MADAAIGARRPRQARSRATENRLLDAARLLLEEGRFDEVSVADLARQAGVSIGGFYARFASKEALVLQLFDDEFLESLIRRVDEELAPVRLRRASAAEVIEAYVRLAVRTFREHRSLARQVVLWTRTSPDAAFRQRVRRFNEHAHGRFRDLLLARSDEFEHPDPKVAVDIGLTFISGAMRQYVLLSDLRPDFRPLSDRRLVQELVRACCSYLGMAPPASRGHGAGTKK